MDEAKYPFVRLRYIPAGVTGKLLAILTYKKWVRNEVEAVVLLVLVLVVAVVIAVAVVAVTLVEETTTEL